MAGVKWASLRAGPSRHAEVRHRVKPWTLLKILSPEPRDPATQGSCAALERCVFVGVTRIRRVMRGGRFLHLRCIVFGTWWFGSGVWVAS